MGKSKKDNKAQNRSNSASGLRQRRDSASSFQEVDGASEAGSPLRNGSANKPVSIPEEPQISEYEKKKASFITRTIWTFIMIGGFFAALFGGHIYILILATVIQVVCFKEVIAISNVPSRARSLRFTKALNWYFLGSMMYYLYGESVIYYFKHILLVDKVLLPMATHHRFISFTLYIIGFVFFVGSLKKEHLGFQFTQFAWTHMALFIIVFQAHFVMNNIFEGMIWFFLPAALVITNDIFAYICGITFGKTPLIKLSPKKTVEGFLGAWVFTIIFGIFFTHYLIKSSYFICPVNDLGANIITGLNCTPNPVFLPQTYALPNSPFPLQYFPDTITVAPIQFHMIVFSTFASLIAPFGGFFASGLKRTFNIKDFGDSIPGHGGVTDRMDCQFIMGFFAYMYYQSFIAVYKRTVGIVIEQAINGLSFEEQKEVGIAMFKHLVNQGILKSEVLEQVTKLVAQQ